MKTHGQEEEVQPKCHAEMDLVRKWERRIANTFKVGYRVMKRGEVVCHSCGDSRCDIYILHAD